MLEEVKINGIERSTSSEGTTEDIERLEEKWTPKHESFLNDIKQECILRSKSHDNRSKNNLYYYRMLSMPTMILPIVSAGISQYIGKELNYISGKIGVYHKSTEHDNRYCARPGGQRASRLQRRRRERPKRESLSVIRVGARHRQPNGWVPG